MDLAAYMERIGYRGQAVPNSDVLHALQCAHLLSVPFENLDIHHRHLIELEERALFTKIVTRRRGGICYELNGLFAALLREVGFQVTLLAARDAHEDGSYGPPFDHLALMVETDEPEGPVRWLADVGWGDTFRQPLRLDERGEQHQDGRAYWLAPEADGLLLWQRDADGAVERQYHFTLHPHALKEFEPASIYHQNSPQSMFTQKRICTQATQSGRVTLSGSGLLYSPPQPGGKLVITENHSRREQHLSGEEDFYGALRHHFGIHLTPLV